MTTVGYGDKCPKSFVGRLFAIVWILIGITACAVYTANLTTDLMAFRSKLGTGIEGKRVGLLKGRLDAITLVNHHGGVPIEVEHNTTFEGILDLIRRLQDKNISGFLLSKDTFQYFSRIVQHKHADVKENMKQHLMLTRKPSSSNSVSYGILVKHVDDYRYFKQYIDTNQMVIEACYTARSNDRSSEVKLHTNFSADKEVFNTFLVYSLAVLGVLFLLGVSYEITTYCRSSHEGKGENVSLVHTSCS